MTNNRNKTNTLGRKLALTLAFIFLFSSLGLPFANAHKHHTYGKENEKKFTDPENCQIPCELFLLGLCEEDDLSEDDKFSISLVHFSLQNTLLFIFSFCKSHLIFAPSADIIYGRIFLLTRKIRV